MSESAPRSRTYRYPTRARWSWAGAFLISAAVAIGALVLQLSSRADLMARGQLLIFTAVFTVIAVHAYGALRIVRHDVELCTEGIMSGGSLVPWAQVRSIEIQPLVRRMDVYDDGGRRVLRLRPELEAFAGVQAYIIEHMNPPVAEPPTEVPLLTPITGVVPLFAFGLIAVWFGPRQSGMPALLFVGVVLLLVLLSFARRRTLRLERDRVVLQQGWRRIEVPYGDIAAVRVAWAGADGRARVVALERSAEESIVVAGFRGGYRAAYAAIEHAWRMGRQG